MKAHWLYLQYVIRHKWYVWQECRKYGLIWRGIKHDWQKFLPCEWFPYVEYFYGPKHPDVGAEGYNHQLHQDDTAFNYAWNHHQKSCSHHWQYYLLNYGDGRTMVLKMPQNDMKEMVADWRGAGLAQGYPNTWERYAKNKDKMQLHPDTRAWIEKELILQAYSEGNIGAGYDFEHEQLGTTIEKLNQQLGA